MSEPVTFGDIARADAELTKMRARYLERWGWKLTCETPGSFWLWRRDFADLDAKRKANDEKSGRLWRSNPFGVITTNTDTAISMTRRELDTADEGEEG